MLRADPTKTELNFVVVPAGSFSMGSSSGADERQLTRYAEYEGNNDKETKPVAGKLPNAWGLYDMHGNVYEWYEDWYGPYGEAPNNGTARTNRSGASGRVLRGGGWGSSARYCRSAIRFVGHPDLHLHILGIRRSLPWNPCAHGATGEITAKQAKRRAVIRSSRERLCEVRFC